MTMRLTLKDFQDEAVAELRKQAAFAAAEATGGGSKQTLILAAPTGSGKTVIAAAWIERLLQGDDAYPSDPATTVLWITDLPELNEQTRRKMETGSSVLQPDDLVTLDATFDAETLDVGKVYFLNIQKLGRGNALVKGRGDKRNWLIWDTITNTAGQRPGSFWVVIDEAHKGMAETQGQHAEATTIVQKFIKGSEGEMPAMPLIFGISATPERFTNLLSGTPRSQRPVTVDADSVRASGLLKDAITLYHPAETQPSDMTMLRDAAEKAKRYDSDWTAYCEKEQAPTVAPILVIQVEDGTSAKLTKTDLDAAIHQVEDALGQMPETAMAHSFQEAQPVILGDDRRLRHVAPADIQDDPELRVVFFKRSLTTGWDCPRAEVMMSFRKAIDQTLIAQLVGRMVRTPLARSVSGSDFLNSVSLYLPHYDEEALDKVIEYLTDPDPEIGFPTQVQRGENLVTLKRNPQTQEAFAAAATLVTYSVAKVAKQSNVRRLFRLGRALAWDKLDKGAGASFTGDLVAVIDTERQAVEQSEDFKARVADAATIDIRAVTVLYGGTEKKAVTSSQLAAVAENVDAAFADAGRKLAGALHAAYLQVRAGQDNAPSVSAIKLELFALLKDASLAQKVEQRAGELLAAALEQHKTAVATLSDERRQVYRHIRRMAADPEAEPWELPDSIDSVKEGEFKRDLHMYVDDAGGFVWKPGGSWEKDALIAALAQDGVVGWLRNVPRKEWALTVPYQYGGQWKPMYPDLLVFRRQGVGVVCDVLEPHGLHLEDSVAKAKGLAEFAKKHGDQFGRIQLIAKFGANYKRLALDDIETRDKVLAVTTSDHLKLLFDDA
ncbi:MAG: DEAD/DEAH box helicase [Solirubrobacteraceae bacterium]